MIISKQIELKAKKEIVDAINILLDRYLLEGLTIGQIKKYFRTKLAQKDFIKDINSAGSQHFEDFKEYKSYAMKILKEILYDKKSEIETMELQKESNTYKEPLTFKSHNNDLFYITFKFDEKNRLDKVENKWDVYFPDWFGLDVDYNTIIRYFKLHYPEYYVVNIKENLKITKFSEFESYNEAMEYGDISAEYLFNDIGFANDDIDILASYFKTKEDYIELKDQKYCLYTITDFKTDITRNNRVKMDVMIIADFQLEKMKDNVTRKILSGVYEQIPQDIIYMGILVKPHTILDKEKLKESVDLIVDKNIINIITSVSKYTFEAKYGDNYYIWKKLK
jgi:hypothetical protein